MRKLFACIFTVLFAICGIFARALFIDYAIADRSEEIGVELCLEGLKTEKITVPEDQDSIVVQDAYKITFDDCDGEVCYSYFKADSAPEKTSEYYRAAFAFLSACEMNIAGESRYLKKMNNFVPENANADIYNDNLYECRGQPFGKDYKYVRIITLDKKNKGCVIITYFCNDLKFFAREGDNYYWNDSEREFNVKGLTARFKE